MTLISILFIICVLLRIKLFTDRYEKGWKALIPFYNKYIIGRTINEKRWGKITALTNFIFISILFSCVGIEYAILTKLPNEITNVETFNLSDYVPNTLITGNTILKILLSVSGIIYFISWIVLTYRFSDKQNSTTWWMLGWGILPVVPYFYYAFINKTVFLAGKGLVEFQKTEVQIQEKPKKVKKPKKKKK